MSEQLYHDVIVATSSMRSRAGNLPNVLCMVALCAGRNFSTCVPFVSGAAISAPNLRSTWSGYVVRRVQRVGRNDMLPGVGVEISRSHLRPAHCLPRGEQHLAAARSCEEAYKKPSKRLSDACRAYGIEGWEGIEKKRSPRISPRAGGAITGESGAPVLRGGRAQVRYAAGQELRGKSMTAAWVLPPPTLRVCCTGRITAQSGGADPSHAECRSTCPYGTWCRRTRRRSLPAIAES